MSNKEDIMNENLQLFLQNFTDELYKIYCRYGFFAINLDGNYLQFFWNTVLYYDIKEGYKLFIKIMDKNVYLDELFVIKDFQNKEYVRVLDLYKPGDVVRWVKDDPIAQSIYETYWNPKPDRTEKDKWISEGRCPDCGTLGKFVNFRTFCDKCNKFYDLKCEKKINER